MRESSKEMHKTGTVKSTKPKAGIGKSQMTTSEENVSGKIVGIEAVADALGVKSIATAQHYAKFYGLPAYRTTASTWEMSVDKFRAWARDIGWTKSMHESELRNRIHRKNLREAGPGNEIRGSINFLEKRLQKNMTTLFDLMRDHEGCPIKKLPDNQYQVFENEWILFMMDITPARKTRREIPY